MACIIQRDVVESECSAVGSGDDIGCQRTVPQAQSDILTRLFHKLMQGAELGIVASLYLDGQQMRLIAYHKDTQYFQIQTKIRRKTEQIQTNFR